MAARKGRNSETKKEKKKKHSRDNAHAVDHLIQSATAEERLAIDPKLLIHTLDQMVGYRALAAVAGHGASGNHLKSSYPPSLLLAGRSASH